MQNYEILPVWQAAHALTMRVYEVTEGFPAAERYVLVPQMRRSSNSIPGNIAEGSGRETRPQFAQFLNYSSGSSSELRYWFYLARELGFLERPTYIDLRAAVDSVQKQLSGFMTYLRNSG